VELEKTVRELQERSFHPSVISSPIEKSATVNEVQPANGSYTSSQRHDEKRQQQEIDLRSSEMHVQKLTNVPNVNLATSQSQQNDNYPTQPHNMIFATSQQNDMWLFIQLFTYRKWINHYLATYDYLKSIIEN